MVAIGRVLACIDSPRADSSSPTAKHLDSQSKSPNPAARLPSPEASASGTTVTLAGGSPTPGVEDSTIGFRREQQPATDQLDCSERLGTESPPDQSLHFQQSPGIHIDGNVQHHHCMTIVESFEAGRQVPASDSLKQAVASQHHLVAGNPAVLMAAGGEASEALQAAAPAVAAAAGEVDGAEAVEEWAPDEEAMQAASALAGLAMESTWAGKIVYFLVDTVVCFPL